MVTPAQGVSSNPGTSADDGVSPTTSWGDGLQTVLPAVQGAPPPKNKVGGKGKANNLVRFATKVVSGRSAGSTNNAARLLANLKAGAGKLVSNLKPN